MRNGYCYGPVVTFGPSKYAGVSGCGDGRRIGGTDVFSGRAKLLWEPTSDISAPLQYEIIRDHSAPAVAQEHTLAGHNFRSEERRGGSEGVRTVRTRRTE